MKVSNIGLIETKIKKLDEQFPVQDWIYVKFLDTIFRDFLILRPLHI